MATTEAERSDLSTYPPSFRLPAAAPSPELRRLAALELPLLDLADLDDARLTAACREYGVFRLADGDCAAWRVLERDMFRWARDAMERPFEEKAARFAGAGGRYFWGTPAVNLPVSEVNWVEGLHIPLGHDGPEDIQPNFYGLGPQFFSEYVADMARIARTLFDALASELGLDEEQSQSYLAESAGTFRVYRYPRSPKPNDHVGMEAHTDSSVLTIVNQDQIGGLQVMHDGAWHDVTPIPGTLVVNLGDMMQAISDDKYRSVTHRVAASADGDRVSLCYFAFPEEDVTIASSKYAPFTYRKFREQVQADIKATGSKVGLSRFVKP